MAEQTLKSQLRLRTMDNDYTDTNPFNNRKGGSTMHKTIASKVSIVSPSRRSLGGSS